MTNYISSKTAKKRLAILWFISSAILFLFFIFHSQSYGSHFNDAWNWFLPTIMPTLSLIIAVFLFDTSSTQKTTKRYPLFFYRLTMGLSAFYLFILILIPAMQPFTQTPPLEHLQRSTLWLTSLQGLVTGALGIFFIKEETTPSEEQASA